MTKNELAVMKVIEGFTIVTKRKVAGVTGITDEYAKYILDHFAEGGFVEVVGRETFKILPKGVEALVARLNQSLARLGLMVERFNRSIGKIEQEKRRLEKRITQMAGTAIEP